MEVQTLPPDVLLSCSAGPVDDPATWSGTPRHLLHALRDAGALNVHTAPHVPTDRIERTARRIDGALRIAHPAVCGPVRRQLLAKRVQEAASALACEATLHFGSYDLPWLPSRRPAYLYVDTSYDLWERHALAARGLSHWRRTWFRRCERIALHRARHVFTVGQHVADNLIERFGLAPASVTAVATGRGSIRPYNGPKDYKAARLLTVAKVRPVDKGLPLLLEAFTIARQQLPQLELTVVGGANYPGIADCDGVRGTGWIAAEELQSLYEQATLFVMPASYEPWGLAYLEALACRTPLMGLDGNALPEITRDGRYGILCASSDPDEFARALVDALASPERLERMGAEGQADCLQRYSWRATADRIASHIVRDLRPVTRALAAAKG